MSDYLFAQPSFLSGMGRVMDLGGAFDDYNFSPTPQMADARGLVADVAAVGREMREAIVRVEAELPSTRP